MRPDYKRALEKLMKTLDKVEERRDKEGKPVKQEGQIVDVTEGSLGTIYQFTEHDLTVYQNDQMKRSDNEGCSRSRQDRIHHTSIKDDHDQ